MDTITILLVLIAIWFPVATVWVMTHKVRSARPNRVFVSTAPEFNTMLRSDATKVKQARVAYRSTVTQILNGSDSLIIATELIHNAEILAEQSQQINIPKHSLDTCVLAAA